MSKQVSANQSNALPHRAGRSHAKGGQAPGSPASSRAKFAALFGIDPRSLALCRIALGVLLLADLLIRASDLRAMYTDEGMFSRMEISYRYTTIWNWSFHFASGAWEFQLLLFAMAGVLALALALGFETRLVTIGSWLMLVSVQHRVPPILSGADILLRLLLFWAMFLPLGRRWSLDNWLKAKRGIDLAAADQENRRVFSVASAAILLQMGMMYLFSALFKSNSDWLQGGVIAGTLAHDFYAKPLGTYLLQYPLLLKVLTWGVFVLEWVGPLLLFCPWQHAKARLAAVTGLAAMHIGIALTVEVDLFSPVALAGLALFLPREFWEHPRLAPFRTPGRGMAQPDGETGLPREKHSSWHYATQGVCLVLLIYVVGINIKTLQKQSPPRGNFLRTGLGLTQEWNMFDETPSKDGWYVARALLKDGTEVDLLRQGSALVWARPENPARVYANHRWRKVFREMSYEDALGFQVFRRPVAEFLCREWNAENPEEREIAEFELIFCSQTPAQTAEPRGMDVIFRERLTRLDFTGS